jgi:hypothetical protein
LVDAVQAPTVELALAGGGANVAASMPARPSEAKARPRGVIRRCHVEGV